MTDYRNEVGRNPRAATLRRGDYLDDPQARRINKALLARRGMTLVEIGFGEHVVALIKANSDLRAMAREIFNITPWFAPSDSWVRAEKDRLAEAYRAAGRISRGVWASKAQERAYYAELRMQMKNDPSVPEEMKR